VHGTQSTPPPPARLRIVSTLCEASRREQHTPCHHAVRVFMCHHAPLCPPAGLEDIKALPYVRQTLAESLRLYPQPPLLIRRSLAPDTLPPGLKGDPEGYPIGAGGHPTASL
jgi:cytochrome P450